MAAHIRESGATAVPEKIYNPELGETGSTEILQANRILRAIKENPAAGHFADAIDHCQIPREELAIAVVHRRQRPEGGVAQGFEQGSAEAGTKNGVCEPGLCTEMRIEGSRTKDQSSGFHPLAQVHPEGAGKNGNTAGTRVLRYVSERSGFEFTDGRNVGVGC